jgi:phosphatidylglycerophosphate synthase
MPAIEDHKRQHEPITGPLERRALRWLASKTPERYGPDTLTVIGIVGSLVIFGGYALTRLDPAFLWLASLGFVLNWFGDSLDGTLARFRKTERPKYGFFVDHTVDVGSEALVFLGLGVSPYARFDIACLGLIGYLMLSVYVYVRTAVDGVFKLSYGGVGPTELRIIVVLANTAIFFWGNPTFAVLGQTLSVLDAVLAFVAVALASVFVVVSLSHALKLRAVGK